MYINYLTTIYLLSPYQEQKNTTEVTELHQKHWSGELSYTGQYYLVLCYHMMFTHDTGILVIYSDVHSERTNRLRWHRAKGMTLVHSLVYSRIRWCKVQQCSLIAVCTNYIKVEVVRLMVMMVERRRAGGGRGGWLKDGLTGHMYNGLTLPWDVQSIPYILVVYL